MRVTLAINVEVEPRFSVFQVLYHSASQKLSVIDITSADNIQIMDEIFIR